MPEFILPENDSNPQSFVEAHQITLWALERLNLKARRDNPNEPDLTPEEEARLKFLDDLLSGGKKRNQSAGTLPTDD